MSTITPTRRLRHDLRTPVNHILGYSQLLIEDAHESGNGGRFPQLEEVAGLGQEILRQIEVALPSPEPDDPEQRIAQLRRSLKPRVEGIRERLHALPFAKGTAQFADVERLHQAASKLASFVETGSLEPAAAVMSQQQDEKESSAAEHLLVVDDDQTNRDLLARILKRLKFRVSVASNGAEALELAAKESFDLVLLDLIMPGMGGHEVLQRLKSASPDLPVIVISALNDMNTVVQCISSGAEDYFLKPFEPVLLRARIGAALDRRKLRRKLVEQQRLASLGELTAGIAHELKNPLNFVLSFAITAADSVDDLEQLLPRESSDARALIPELREDLQKIREHGERTCKILNSMLSHCHTAATQLESANLNELVERYTGFATLAFRLAHQDSDVVVETRLDPAVGNVVCRSAELGNAILNLASNAYHAAWSKKQAKAAESGYAPRIVVSTVGLADAVEIVVRDNGDGVAPELQERTFQPFLTSGPPGEGTGVGLSITQDIVSRGHGGQLLINTRKGEFAGFIIRIPRR